MFKYIISEAGTYNWMAIFALITFIVIFALSIVLVLRSDRKFVDKMAKLPLDETDNSFIEKQ